MRNVYEGLRILLNYDPNGDFSTGHEVIYSGPDHNRFLQEELLELHQLEWFFDNEEFHCWMKFV